MTKTEIEDAAAPVREPAELTEGELSQVAGAGLPLIRIPPDGKCPTAVE